MNPQDFKKEVKAVLEHVKDPELPEISIVELGMLHQIDQEGPSITITLLPTFSGCPALDIIEKEVKEEIQKLDGVTSAQVVFSYDPPWTTNRLQKSAREKLKKYGISPPPPYHKEGEPWVIECPYCGSDVVTMENLFGPTACRSILYCRNCRNPFEAMKPVANQ